MGGKVADDGSGVMMVVGYRKKTEKYHREMFRIWNNIRTI